MHAAGQHASEEEAGRHEQELGGAVLAGEIGTGQGSVVESGALRDEVPISILERQKAESGVKMQGPR